MTAKKSISTIVRAMSDKAVASAARLLSDKDLATAIRRGSKALHQKMLPCVLGEALREGEIVVADGPDLPPELRKQNAKRLAKLPKAEREEMAKENGARLSN